MRNFLLFCWCAAPLMLSGCATNQLRRTTPQHSDTLADIYEQQVLNNLARFCVNPGSTPSFAVPQSGTNAIAHGNQMNGGLNFNATTFTGSSLGLNGTRQQTVNWTIRAISNPVRLSLMKYVFQYATCRSTDQCGSDCLDQLTKFFEGDLSSCRLPRCFYSVHDRKCEPIDRCCEKSGEYCGTTIVVSKKNFDKLSRLTLAILDIATLSDEDVAARMRPPANKEVLVEETITIKEKDGTERVVTGTYSVDPKDYQDLREELDPATTDGGNIRTDGSSVPDPTAANPKPTIFDRRRIFSPAEIYPRRGERRIGGDINSDLESQIQAIPMSPLFQPF
ncbi:MAG: hypothetical protein AAF670_15800 [Planctomycetota bacterium]